MNSVSPTRVGCQPTDPRAEFRLQNHNMEDITASLADNALAWSPQSGLWVLAGNLQLHSGVSSCSLRLPSGETRKQLVSINFIKPIVLIPPR